MGKMNVRGLLIGICIGSLGLVTVYGGSGLKAETAEHVTVFFNNQAVKLTEPLAAVTEEGAETARLYLPLHNLLEHMGYVVHWDEDVSSVFITGPEMSVTDLRTAPVFKALFPSNWGEVQEDALYIEVTANLQSEDDKEHAARIEIAIVPGGVKDKIVRQSLEGAVREKMLGYLRSCSYQESIRADTETVIKPALHEALKELIEELTMDDFYITTLYFV